MRSGVSDPRTRRAKLTATATAFVVAAGVFVFYVAVYRVRGFRLPVGFDSPWYLWRAQFVQARGIGPLDTAIRPGHALLAAVIGSLTGRSQLELQVILPLVLVGVFALAVGAFVVAGTARTWGGPGWAAFGAAAATGGVLLGTTRLVGENVANLILVALAAAALAGLARSVAGRGPPWGAVVLLVAGGLAHWAFLWVVLAMLLVAAALAAPASRRDVAAGRSWLRTESGIVGGVATIAGAAMVATIAWVLKAPFGTFEIQEDPARYVPKLRTDLSRVLLPLTAPVGALGVWVLLRRWRREPGNRALAFTVRVLLAWTAVGLAGVAYGVVTKNLPPHRFLALVVAVPVAVVVSIAVIEAGSFVLRRRGLGLALAALVIGVALVAVPGALAWYRHGPGEWISPEGLQESRTAAAYVRSLPPGRPVVFVVGPFGSAGVVSMALKERTIRVAIPPSRQRDVHVFVGEPSDALAGRRTVTGSPKIDAEALPYWEDVRGVLRPTTPVLVLKGFGTKQYREAIQGFEAPAIGPGVALLRGPRPSALLVAEPLPAAVPRFPVAVAEGVAILVLLSVAGLGWTRVLFGPDVPPEVVAGVTPAMGCAVLMLGALAAVETGVRLQGAGGVLTFVVVAGLGAVLAWVRPPRLESRPPLRAEPIETDRFVLRPLRIDDADEMAAVLADPALHRYTGGRPADADELRVRFANVATERSPDGREAWLNWIVRLRDGDAAVGTVQATVGDHEATLAWIVGVPWQGRGVASEAAAGMVEWLRARGIEAMAAHIHPDHEASAAVARRVGLHPTDEVVDGEVVWRSDPS